MNPEKMLAEARAEHATLSDKLANVQKLIRVLEDMIGGTSGDESRLAVDTTIDYPSPRDAVLAAMKTRPGVALEPREVTAMVKEIGIYNEGLKSGPTAYSTALSRLAEDDDSPIIRSGVGQYIYLPIAAQVLTGKV